MKPPIIVDNRGDVGILKSVESAEKSLEPIDVLNSEYVIYDSEGRLLKASVEEKKVSSVFGVPVHRESVVLSPVDQEPAHEDDLRRVLIRFLGKVSKSTEALEDYSLEQLIDRAREFGGE